MIGERRQETAEEPAPRRYGDLKGPNLTPGEGEAKRLEKVEVQGLELENELKIYLDISRKGKTLLKNTKSKKDFHNPDYTIVRMPFDSRILSNRSVWSNTGLTSRHRSMTLSRPLS